MSSRDVLAMINKWEALNNSFSAIGDQLAIKAVEFPEVSHFSGDSDFRALANALSALRNEIGELGRDVNYHTSALSSDMRYFFDLSKDYDSELDVFRKGRDQAFQLYDKLSEEHRELLREYESVKADLKLLRDDIDGAKTGQVVAEEALEKIHKSQGSLIEELSTLRVSEATLKKRIEMLEDENRDLSDIRDHEDMDRNQLVQQLAKEIKSRNDALVLAEAARNELSRLFGEAGQDRLAREEADRSRDEALGSVEGLNALIEELKQEVEEQEKMCRHETLMRHKIEEALLAREDELKQLTVTKESLDVELEEAKKSCAEADTERQAWREEKDSLTSQIGVLAQQMASERLENQKLMETLKSVQSELANSKTVSDDAVEKAKQLERIVNQLIQDKAELNSVISKLEKEKAQIMEDSRDVVSLRTNLENKVKGLGEDLSQMKGLFEEEKKLKEETAAALGKAEETIQKHDEQMTKLSEKIKDRDDLRNNLDAIQKVLQSERQSKSELSKSYESASLELGEIRKSLLQEQQLKNDALRSLEAESLSKKEVISKLKDLEKSDENSKSSLDKSKSEVSTLKDKLKEEERTRKDLNKQIDDLRKELGKATTETEKMVRGKEEASRKADSEAAAHKESDKALAAEKSEREKTTKSLMEEKSKREQLEVEVSNLKAQTSEAQRAVDSERAEHSKTYKAYESEKSARATTESEISRLKTEVAEAKSNEQSLLAEKQVNDKRIRKLEESMAELSVAKEGAGREAATRKQLDHLERVKAELEGKVAMERQKRVEAEDKLKQVRSEDEEMRIRFENTNLENQQLAKHLARLEIELETEKKVKADLVAAIEKRVDDK